MTQWPTTRHSLILNLAKDEDQSAWFEFAELYEPVIYRFARRRGLQHDDSVELVQRVLVAVHKSAAKWSTEQPPNNFRGWLATVAANCLINHVNREYPKRSKGGTSNFDLKNQALDSDESNMAIWQEEEQRSILREAATKIRDEFQPDSWTAFYRTLIDGEPVASVARELNKTEAAVYAARARIVRRLQSEVKRIAGDQNE